MRTNFYSLFFILKVHNKVVGLILVSANLSLELSIQNRKFKFFDESKEKEWKEPFFFIQGADTQFGLIAKEIEGKKDITWEKEIKLTEDVVQRINEMNPKPKFFVVCGDLCDAMPDTELDMRNKQVSDFKRIFSSLHEDIPLICLCGNHDVGNTPTIETIKM